MPGDAGDTARHNTVGRDDTERPATRHRKRHDDTATRLPEATPPPTTSLPDDMTRQSRGPDGTAHPSSTRQSSTGDSPTTAAGRQRAQAATKAEAERGKNYSFTLPPSLMARVRSAQWHTNNQPDGYQTVSAMVRELVAAEVERLEATYNAGLPWPKVEGRLPSGPGPEGAARGAQLRARNRKSSKSSKKGPQSASAGAPEDEHPA